MIDGFEGVFVLLKPADGKPIAQLKDACAFYASDQTEIDLYASKIHARPTPAQADAGTYLKKTLPETMKLIFQPWLADQYFSRSVELSAHRNKLNQFKLPMMKCSVMKRSGEYSPTFYNAWKSYDQVKLFWKKPLRLDMTRRLPYNFVPQI